MSGIVVILGLVVLLFGSIGALIAVFRHFSWPRFFAVLGCPLLLLTSALLVVGAGWTCAFGCGDANIQARIIGEIFAPDAEGFIIVGAIVCLVLAWLFELMALSRRQSWTWFWRVAVIPCGLWSVATIILITHLPQTERDLDVWLTATLVASLLYLAGHLVTLIATLQPKAAAPQAMVV